MGCGLSKLSNKPRADSPRSPEASPSVGDLLARSPDAVWQRMQREASARIAGRAPALPSAGPAASSAQRPRPPGSLVLGVNSDQLLAKAQRVDDLLARTPPGYDPAFREYAQHAVERARGNLPPNLITSSLDADNLAKLMEVENARNPGLTLRHQRHQDQFIDDLLHTNDEKFRAVFPLTQVDSPQAGAHHVMADVRKPPGQPPTVVICETVGLQYQAGKHVKFWKTLQDRQIDTSRVGVIENTAQRSERGCAMFSMHFAIKSHKNEAIFDQMHQALRERTGLVPGQSAAQTAGQASELALMFHHDDPPYHDTFDGVGTDFAPGQGVLPTDFYKHAHSKTVARETFNRPLFAEMRSARGLAAEDARVNSRANHGDNAMTLQQRQASYQVTRYQDQRTAPMSYSASIEGFRLQEIARRLEADLGAEVKASKASTVQKEQSGLTPTAATP
jgi:YopJ Serine/Threonine acetyltransferase